MMLDPPLRVNDLKKSISILANINWNFSENISLLPDSTRPFDCRKHHWFPATFVPEIPFALIEILTKPDATVFDPFGGIGTTYFQALSLGRIPITLENSKIAVNYMKSLFKLFNKNIKHLKLLDNLKIIINNYDDSKKYIHDIPDHIMINELEPWYSYKTLNKLSYLFIEQYANINNNLFFLMNICISSILKSVSSQDRGWGCIADNMKPKQSQIRDKDVFSNFLRRSNILINDITSHLKNLNKRYEINYKKFTNFDNIYYGDIKKFNDLKANSIDIIISSPPYPNMTDYVKAQRLSYYYYGIDMKVELKNEIGARFKRHRMNALNEYYDDMMKTNNVISEILKPSGYLCYLLPHFDTNNNNNIKRKLIINKILSHLENKDFINEATFTRLLPSMKRTHNIKWVSLEKEEIKIYRKI